MAHILHTEFLKLSSFLTDTQKFLVSFSQFLIMPQLLMKLQEALAGSAPLSHSFASINWGRVGLTGQRDRREKALLQSHVKDFHYHQDKHKGNVYLKL